MDGVLLHGEAELFIKNLEKASLKDIGSPRWFLQHEHFEKLNMQAIVNASALQETFVKDLIISYEQISTLVHELILTEVWKCKILPIICKLKDLNPDSSFLFCMVIHHEATIINLLETIMFHKESCEAAGDSALDLLDYCLRKLTQLAGRAAHTGVPTQDPLTLQQQVDSLQDLERQRDELDFDIAIKCLSVLCFLIEHIDSLGLSVLSRMLNTHNLPCLLVQLVEHCPWSRGSSGKLEKYTEGKWRPVSAEDHLKLNKHDGLLWMCLFNLLLSPDCHRKYQFNSFNKEQLLKLRVYLSDTVMDQIPNLVELQRFLSQLAITDPVPPKKELILEMVPEIWSDILTENSGKWKAIAKHQVKHFFKVSDGELRERASRLAQTYNMDAMMNLLPDPAKCGSCGSASVKRCSRCQNEWYCNRECQVKHWPKHKTVCNQMSELLKKQQDPS